MSISVLQHNLSKCLSFKLFLNVSVRLRIISSAINLFDTFHVLLPCDIYTYNHEADHQLNWFSTTSSNYDSFRFLPYPTITNTSDPLLSWNRSMVDSVSECFRVFWPTKGVSLALSSWPHNVIWHHLLVGQFGP